MSEMDVVVVILVGLELSCFQNRFPQTKEKKTFSSLFPWHNCIIGNFSALNMDMKIHSYVIKLHSCCARCTILRHLQISLM